MSQYVETPQGVVEFPDGMDQDQISAALRDHFNPQPTTFQDYVTSPIKQGKQVADIAVTDLGRRLGLFSPETAAERNVEDLAEMAKAAPSKKLQAKLDEIDEAGKPKETDEGWSDAPLRALAAYARNPSVVGPLVLQSLVASAPTLGAGVAGMVGGPLGGAAGAGLGSYQTEYANTILEAFREKNIDVTDPQALAAAYRNQEVMDYAAKKANARGIPIGAFDALSFGVAGLPYKVIAAGRGRLGKIAGGLAEAGTQATLGGSGEAAAQLADKGKITSYKDIIDEAVGEIVPGAAEAAIKAARTSKPPVASEATPAGPPQGAVDRIISPEGNEAPKAPETPAGENTPEGQRVYDWIHQRLLASNMDPQRAIQEARVARAIYETAGTRQGTDAWTEFQRDKIEDIRTGTPDQKGTLRKETTDLGQDVVGHDSLLRRALIRPKINTNTPQGWINYLKNNGVKDEELEWSGLGDWLYAWKESSPGKRIASNDVRNAFRMYPIMAFTVQRDPSTERMPEGWSEYGDYTLDKYGLDPKSNYREVIIIGGNRNAEDTKPAYRSRYWPVPNPIAHYRATDRSTPDGKSVMFTEEVQSEWHQAGQERGYRPNEAEMSKMADKRAAAWAKLARLLRANDNGGHDTPTEAWKEIRARLEGEEEYGNEYSPDVWEAAKEYLPLRQASDKAVSGVADGPFKQSWPNLTFRYALLDAIKNDKDYIAWTTGEQQADRYWSRDDPDYAKKRKGLEAFYDKRLVDYANKLGKQFGARVESLPIGSEEYSPPNPGSLEQQPFFKPSVVTVHALPITPKMREFAATSPFNLFQTMDAKRAVLPGESGGERVAQVSFKGPTQESDRKALILLGKNAPAGAFLHELMHIRLESMRRDAPNNPEIAHDLKVLMDWVGIDSPHKIKVEQHEQIARGFEQYLRNGKAPTPALKEVFEKIRQWLMEVYAKASDLRVKLSPAAKEVYARMLGAPRVEGPSLPVKPTTGINPFMGGFYPQDNETSSLGQETTLGKSIFDRFQDSGAGRAWNKVSNPLGNLPKQRDYMVQRMLTQGRADEINKFAERMVEGLGKDPAQMQPVYDFLTTRGANPAMIKDPKVRAAAQQIKNKVNQISTELVRAGKIDTQSAANFHDQYLPRLYLKYLIEKKGMKASGIKASNEDYTRQRRALTADEKKALGEVKDPKYLAYVALTRPLRDLAVNDMMEQVAKNPDWVWQGSLVNWQGKMVTPYWLEAEASEIRKRKVLEPNPQTKQDMERIATQMETVAAQNNPYQDYDQADFVKMPNTKPYGQLRGAVVRKEIAADIKGMESFADPNNFMERWLGDRGSVLVKANQLWKEAKVVWNPPTQVRNFVSNLMLLHLSGVPFHRMITLVPRAAKEILRDGQYWKVAKKYGINSSTMTEAELRQETDKFLKNLETNNHGRIRGSLAPIMKAGAFVRDKAREGYQLSEHIGKVTKIMDAMEREGKNEADAALEANKWLFDYSLVSPSVRYLRNAPLGMPFVTFTTKVIPLLAETAMTPRGMFRLGGYYLLAQAVPYIVAGMNDIDTDDVERLRKSLSERLRKRGDMYLIPYKDEHNRWQFVDVGYFFPWQQVVDFGRNISSGDLSEAARSVGVLSSPVVNAITALATGVDSFTGQPIMNKLDPPREQAASLMSYVWGLVAPPSMTQYGAVGRILDQQSGTGLNRYGEPGLTDNQIIARMFGVNVNPVVPDAQRGRNLLRMQNEITQEKARMNMTLRDQSLSPERRATIIKRFQEDLIDRYKKMQKYIEETAPTPKLTAATARKDT